MGIRVSLFTYTKQNYYWDEIAHLHLAKNIHDGLGYTSPIGETFRPPLLPFIVSFTTNETLIHFTILLIVVLTLITFYLFVKKMYSSKEGFIATILLMTLPLYFFWSSKILTNPLALLLIITSLYSFFQWTKLKKEKYLYFAAITSALSILARVPAIILPITLLVYSLTKEKLNLFKKKEYLIASLLFLITLIPYFYLGIKNYSHPLGMVLYQNSLLHLPPNYLFYIKNLYNNLGPIIFLFLIGLFRINKKNKLLYHYLIIFFIFNSLVLSHNTQNRFFILALPAVLPIAASGYTFLTTKFKKLRFPLYFLLLLLICSNLYQGYTHVKEDPSNTALLIEAAKSIPKGTTLCNSIPYCSYYSNNPIPYFQADNAKKSFPDTTKELITAIKEKDVSYLFVDNYHLESPYTDFINETFKLIYSKDNNNKYIRIYKTKWKEN